MTFLIKNKSGLKEVSMKLFSISSSSDNQSFVFLSETADERRKSFQLNRLALKAFQFAGEIQHFLYLIIQLSELNNNSSGEC